MMLLTLITTVLSIIAALIFAALMTLVPIALLVLIIVLIVKACNKKEKEDEPVGEYVDISLEEKTVNEVLDTFTDEQKQVINSIVNGEEAD